MVPEAPLIGWLGGGGEVVPVVMLRLIGSVADPMLQLEPSATLLSWT